MSSLYDGDMSRVGMNVIPGQTVGVTQDVPEIFHQFIRF